MLYIFHVDTGKMATYDMNYTLESVSSLKLAIEKKTKIPASKLVLLVSGGEVLQSHQKVSSYSAGTDSTPIYMFTKPTIRDNSNLRDQSGLGLSPIVELSEFRSDACGALDGNSEADLKTAVEKCCSLPPAVNTVTQCANLAQRFSDLAQDIARTCENLVHEQHLQHQGWTAVVANLEDIQCEFNERARTFQESFKKHSAKKDEYYDKLNTLTEVLDSLGKILLLPALKLNADAHRFSAFDVFEETDFEGPYQRVRHRLYSCSSDNKGCQDFGVEALKLSEEEVFEQQQNEAAAKDGSGGIGSRIVDSDEGVTFKTNYEKDEPTLLQWILAQGNKASLHDIIDFCQKGLAKLDDEEEPKRSQKMELQNMLGWQDNVKYIRGIEERLFGLDQLLSEAKRLARDQHDQAASLIQNRDRLNTACDLSVLPTLVKSHQCQLDKLLKAHHLIIDIGRRIAKSKDELCFILKARLEAVLKMESLMSVNDANEMMSYLCFNRVSRYFGIVSQLHCAPAVFVRAVSEVARRRTFAHAHLRWANDLASKLLKIHDEEVARRQEFNAIFETHFLKSLFPGMTDLPPAFATQAPPPFDNRLPALTDADVELVFNTFPDLAKDIPHYNIEETIKFFQEGLQVSEHENVDVQVDLSKDESETETSDFEKLSRQGSKKQKADISIICVPDTVAVSTVTEVRSLPVIVETEESPIANLKRIDEFENSEFYIEESLPSSLEWGRGRQDNMDSHRLEVEKLKNFLHKLCALCQVSILFIKEEVANLKLQINENKEILNDRCNEMLKAWEKSNQETAIRFREETQRLTVDHELELSDMKATLTEKDDVISTLREEKEDLKLEHQNEIERLLIEQKNTKELLEKSREEVHDLENKIEEKDILKQKEVRELQEKMHMDYKAEIESIRTRFRLCSSVTLTNTDRSPSESSLEMVERTNVIEISSHNAIVMQTKENAEVEKEEAVKQAVAAANAAWQQRLDDELAALKAKLSANDTTRRLLSEKDRQLETLREREQLLNRECIKLKATIQQLTDPETNDYDALVKTQIASLENENLTLKQELQELKKEMEKRDDTEKSDSDGRSSPRREERAGAGRGGPVRARSHTPLGLPKGALSLSACLPEHNVFVMWDPAHLNYTVLQEAPIMYFVHSDCLPALDLSIHVKNESERRLYAVATVESKEFCYAKKSGNRYHMPREARFYRVRVRPTRPRLTHPCCEIRHRQDAMKTSVIAALSGNRPLKKWLTYVHAKDLQRSVDTSQSTSSTTEEASRVPEVATATLINLESPSTSEAAPATADLAPPGEDQLDSIEASEQWHNAKLQLSGAGATCEMECSVGRCLGPEPLELTVSAVSVVARGSAPPDSEVAEEASP